MPQCLPDSLPASKAFGKRRCSKRIEAPTRSPFRVRHAGSVSTALAKKVHVAGLPTPAAPRLEKVMKRPIFANLSRQKPGPNEEAPRRPIRAKYRLVRRYDVAGPICKPAMLFAPTTRDIRPSARAADVVLRDAHASEARTRAITSTNTPHLALAPAGLLAPSAAWSGSRFSAALLI